MIYLGTKRVRASASRIEWQTSRPDRKRGVSTMRQRWLRQATSMSCWTESRSMSGPWPRGGSMDIEDYLDPLRQKIPALSIASGNMILGS